MAEGNGHQFEVELSGAVREQLAAALRRANTLGQAVAVRRAMLAIGRRLRTDAHRAGEPLRYLKTLRVTIRKLAVAPVYIEYIVHDSAPAVFVRRVVLMAEDDAGV